MIKSLTPRHHEIARRMMRSETQCQIAEYVGLRVEHVSRIVNSPVFQEHLNELNEQADSDVVQYFRERSMIAAQYITGLLDDPGAPPSLKLAAAKEVLKQAAVSSPGKDSGSGPGYMIFEDRMAFCDTVERIDALFCEQKALTEGEV